MEHLADELWQAFLDKLDESTFQPVYTQTKGMVWTLCFRILGNEEDARDAFQSAYLRLFIEARAGAIQVMESKNAIQIICRTAVREADSLRMRRKRRVKREVAMEILPSAADSSLAADQVAAQKQLRYKLETLVQLLPERCRLPLQLHYFHGLSRKEIGEFLNLTPSAVTRRFAVGLKKLKPLVQRAGLGDMLPVLGGGALIGALIEPPATLSAAAVFMQIQHALIAGTAATAGASAHAFLPKMALLIAKMKVAISVTAAVTAIGLGAMLTWGPLHHRSLPRKETVRPSHKVATVPNAIPNKPDQGRPVVPSNSAKANNQAQKAALPAPQTAKTLVPLPAGPTQTLTAAVQWEENQREVQDAEVTLMHEPAKDMEYQAAGKTDKDGLVKLIIPQSWKQLKVHVSHPDAVDDERAVSLPQQESLVLYVKPGGKIFGTVRLARSQEPAAVAEIKTANATDPRGNKTVQTKVDGSYEVTSLPPGEVKVTAALGNLRSDMDGKGGQPAKAYAGGRSGPVDLYLEPGATVRGRVLNAENGKPIAGAEIKIVQKNSHDLTGFFYYQSSLQQGSLVSQSDKNGEYIIEGMSKGQLNLIVSAEHFIQTTQTVNIPRIGESQQDFELDPSIDVHMHVVDEKNNPMEGVLIEKSGVGKAWFSGKLKTDNDGKVVVHKVDRINMPGFEAKKLGFKEITHNVGFNAEKSQCDWEIVLGPTTEMDRVITGRIIDKDGKPIPLVKVQWSPQRGAEEGRDTTATNENGVYRLRFQDDNNMCHLSAFGNGLAPVIKQGVRAGSAEHPAEINFTLNPGHWLKGKVVDEVSKPVNGVKINVMPAEIPYSREFPGVSRETSTAEDGLFALTDLPDPPLTVSLDGPKADNWSSTTHKIAGVDQEVSLTLQAKGYISGRVLDKETGQPVSTFRVKGIWFGSRDFTDPDGRFVLKDLLRIKYNITVEATNYISKVLKDVSTLPQAKASEQNIRLSKGHKLTGVIVEAQTQTPIAGVSVGLGQWDGSGIYWPQLIYSKGISDFQEVSTEIDGAFEFSEEEPGAIFINAPGHRRVILRPNERSKYSSPHGPLRIPLAKGESINGEYKGRTENPHLQNLSLARINNTEDERFLENAEIIDNLTIDGENHFGIDSLNPGTYQLWDSWKNSESPSYPIRVIHEFKLEAGEHKVISISTDFGNFSYKGTALNLQNKPIAHARLQLIPSFTCDYKYFLCYIRGDQGSRFCFPKLKPGRYDLNIQFDYSPPVKAISLPPVEVAGDIEHDIQIPDNAYLSN